MSTMDMNYLNSIYEEGYEIDYCGTTWFIIEVTPEVMKDLQRLDGDEYEVADDGRTHFDLQKIYVNADLHSHRKSVTVVHELLHVACDYLGIPDDEEMIRALEHSIYSLVKVFPEEYK